MRAALPLAAGIAVSPVPIAVLILVLLSSRGRVRGTFFAGGWTAGVLAAAGVGFAVSDGSKPDPDRMTMGAGGIAEVVLGVLFAALAVREWRRHAREGPGSESPRLLRAVDSLAHPALFGLGMAAVVNPVNLPLAVTAGIGIAHAGGTAGRGAAEVLAFTLLASSTLLVPVAAVLLLGDRVRRPLDAAREWLVANGSTILAVLFTVLAAGMLGSPLAQLG